MCPLPLHRCCFPRTGSADHASFLGLSPVHKPSLFSISRTSTPVNAQEQLPGSGSVRVERWIEDQRGEDQDPFRLSPMPRHSDTLVHPRRFTPVRPRTPLSQRDGSEFVFVDEGEEVSAHARFPDNKRRHGLTGCGPPPPFFCVSGLVAKRDGTEPEDASPRWPHFWSIRQLLSAQESEDVAHANNKEGIRWEPQ